MKNTIEKKWKNTLVFVGIFGTMMLFLVGNAFSYEQNLGPNYSEERHTLMQKAFAEKDYDSWLNLMKNNNAGKQTVTKLITEENFERFVEMHNFKMSGDVEKEIEIKNELGLFLGKRKREMNNEDYKENKNQRKKQSY